jgi:glyoxylase-like metal-dependent hydrolase (beta-lactamase superfamily II)
MFFEELLPGDFAARGRAIEDLPAAPLDAPFEMGRDVAGDGSMVAVPLPGHAAGQYGLFCRLAGDRRILLCADAAWLRVNIAANNPPTWAARLIADDYEAFTRTQSRLREFSLRHPEVRIIPSHCEQSIAAYDREF